MNKTTKTILAILATGACISVGAIAYNTKSLEVNNLQLKLDSYQIKYEEQELLMKEMGKEIMAFDVLSKETKKELSKRDNTLEEYRKHLDKLEPIVEKHNKECPTQIAAKSSSRKSTYSQGGTPINMTLTFYGDGAEENGGYAGITAYGQKLSAGMVASNVYPRGTQFSYNGQIYTVQDRGGSNFNSRNRLDVFVPRLPGESKSAYDKRISSYGRKTVSMTKL